MINILTHGINKIKFAVPGEILNLVFKSNLNRRDFNTSIDELIKRSVLIPIVMVDCNIMSGMTTDIPLSSCRVLSSSMTETVIVVDKKLTGGKSVLSALNITIPTDVPYENNDSNPAIRQMANSMLNNAPLAISRMDVVGENIIKISGNLTGIWNAVLTVSLENNIDMSNINIRSADYFAELCEYAIKAYIYNEWIIQLDKGQLYSGHQIGKIGEIIESYSDSHTEYREFLNNTWAKVAYMDDNVRMNKHVNMYFGGAI